ncbi:sensor histidine kinase [Flammeovirga agarivorans]|uniref:histidine kinase n=1 Tax=Flammeovirga agarivorans TaxID=2726742 RepID=A0A7X8SPD1_9BACT|nr:ATP-binding protein [Flammeovirga agarivorans]NLR93817.1 histidine kinase [Flammeovirga agarivorans]
MVIKVQYIVVLIIVLTIIILFTFQLYRAFIKKILEEKTIQYRLEIEHQKEVALQQTIVQENERKRIAEVLHDDVGNKLNILSLWINNEDTWNSERSKEIIVQQIPELIETTRTISHSLYPVNLEKFGLILTLEALVSNVNHSLSIDLVHQNYKQRDISFELQIYRIIQEFLSNVIKHAKATKMVIHLRDQENALAVVLSDNGIGFDQEQLQEGMGLENINSRIQSIEAYSKWKSKTEKGVRLIIVHPKK